MRSLRISLVVFLVAHAGVSFSHDYWPTSADYTYYYENDAGFEVVLEMRGGVLKRTYQSLWYTCSSSHWFEFAQDHLAISREEAVCALGPVPIPTGFNYSSSMLVLAASIEVGQSWSSSSTATDYYGNEAQATLAGESLSIEHVVVPAGDFDVVVVELDPGSMYLPAGLYYLSKGVGPVILPGGYKLTAIGGTVSSESRTWGALKALWR